MKHLFTLFLTLTAAIAFGQHQRINPHQHDVPAEPDLKDDQEQSIVNDDRFDVHFYHIDVEIGVDNPYIEGSVTVGARAVVNGLSEMKLDLDDALLVSAVAPGVSSFTQVDDVLTLQLDQSYDQGDLMEFTISYSGNPALQGGIKGLRYETHGNNEPIIASLTTPYLGHSWWPCKDGTSDKADSTYIDITIKDTIIENRPLIAVSNGLLEADEVIGNKRKFSWRHRYPVVPYYVMVAISNYTHFQQMYTEGSDTFPLDYYVFESHLVDAQVGTQDMLDVMDYFSTIFGPYPFRKEKYAMSQLGYYGGIENQTNAVVNNMSMLWFSVSVHELAHMWFADNITCETWSHGWLNEGFATYSEALYEEHTAGFSGYQQYMSGFVYLDGGTIYKEDVSDPFDIFVSIIYSKGAYVLHMLRGVMGDEAFFAAIKAYATAPETQYGLATTEDFQAYCETVGGEDLDFFFDQWIYDEFHPRYRYNFLQDEDAGTLDLTIVQDQGDFGWRPVFEMPIELRVVFDNGSDTLLRVWNDARWQNYSFSIDQPVSTVALDPDLWILRQAINDPVLNVGISETEKERVLLFPNPNSGSFQLTLPNHASQESVEIAVYDLNGKRCFASTAYAIGASGYQVNTEGLSPGLYTLKVTVGEQQHYQKMSVAD